MPAWTERSDERGPAGAPGGDARAGDGLHLPQRNRDPLVDPDCRVPVSDGPGRRRLHPGLPREGLQRGGGPADVPLVAPDGTGLPADRPSPPPAAPGPSPPLVRDLLCLQAYPRHGALRVSLRFVPDGWASTPPVVPMLARP